MARRMLIVIALAVSTALAGCGVSSDERAPNRAATLLLDSRPNAVHTGIYTAVDRGFDKALGVTLRIRVPSASTNAVKRLVSGRTDFAILDIHDLAIAREHGRDLVGVMAIVEEPLARLRTQRSSRRPRDLKRAPSYPELVLSVTRKTLQRSPGLVRASVAAISRGYEEVIADPENGVSSLLAATTGLKRERVQRELDAVSPSFTAGARAFGELDPKRLRAWARWRWQKRSRIGTRELDVARAFDGRYVPPPGRD